MKRFFFLFCFFSYIVLSYANTGDEDFIRIEKLIDNKAYDEAEKLLNKMESSITQSTNDIKELFYCNRGYLFLKLGDYNNSINALNSAMQIIYEEKWFNIEEHLRVAYYMAKAYYSNGDITNAGKLINMALVRGSDIWEESRFSTYMYQLLVPIYEKSNVSSEIVDRLKYEIQSMPTKSNINRDKSFINEVEDSISYNVTFPIESYIFQIDSICEAYANNDRLDLSEKVLKEADSTLLSYGLQSHPLVRKLHVRKGQLCFLIQDWNNAKKFFLMSKKIYEQTNDVYSIDYADCLNSLALVYQEQGKYIYSTIMLYAALANCQNGQNKMELRYDIYSSYLAVNDNLAKNYYLMGERKQALKTWNEIIIAAENGGYWNAAFSAIVNYAYAQIEIGNYQEGINKLKRIIHQDYGKLLKEAGFQNLLMSQYLANDTDIVKTLKEYINYSKTNLSTILSSYSESERENYWNQQAMALEWITNAICWKFMNRDLSLLALNITLTLRSMQQRLYQTMRNYFLHDAPIGMKEQYHELMSSKQQLANKSTHKDSLFIIRDNINSLEKILLTGLKGHWALFNDSIDNFATIKSSLLDKEVAIEFVQIPEIVSVDSINILYAAWIIRKDYKYPILVELCYDDEVDDILYQHPDSVIYSINEDASAQLYRLIFHPLERYLQDGDIIYYSPVGEIHRVNLMAIPFNGKRLMDLFSLIRVSSIANITMRETNKSSYATAVLYGGIKFNEGIDEMAIEAMNYSEASPIRHSINRSISRSLWDELPGSLFEVKEISSILSSNNTSATLIIGKQANEESVKAFSGKSPDIIHIATHGFYYSKTEQKKYSFFDNTFALTQKNMFMQSCGLLFAGANNVWGGNEIPEGMEDGILTAEEISHLDLTNTKLCVLSACNTGLGEIDDIEGVYGVQHALKMAGVESILMCLNKVDDEATRILMVEFYKNLMSGKTKLQSLKDAQQYLRQVDNGKYDDPKYWAPFILLDAID